jgi:hypothetical protein
MPVAESQGKHTGTGGAKLSELDGWSHSSMIGPSGARICSSAMGPSQNDLGCAHVAPFRIADHLSGVAHDFPEPGGSWLNGEITCRAPRARNQMALNQIDNLDGAGYS